MMLNPAADIVYAIPLMVLLVVGLVLMILDALKLNKVLPIVAGVGLVISAILAIPIGAESEYALRFNSMLGFGGIASLIHIFLSLSGFFTLFFLDHYMRKQDRYVGEAYSLLIFATIGMIIMANSNDLIMLFVGLEIMSVAMYVMASLYSNRQGSNESGLKYFLLGAFSTGFLLYGIALLYGISGLDPVNGPSTQLDKLSQSIELISDSPIFYVSIALIITGFSFKIAAFPFHNWTPDVYTGAPTPLAGFMATGGKMAAFVALTGFLSKFNTPGVGEKLVHVMGIMAVISMIYGNIVAVQQTNVKRMLAYSSIAHSGYVLLGVCAGPSGYKGAIFYMIIYTLMTVGAFGVISIVEKKVEDSEMSNWKGLGISHPILGIVMSVFLFSLAGMPPFAGFMGKYFVFGAAIQKGLYTWSILGILSSVIGAYYYLRLIVVMYFQKSETESEFQLSNVMTPLIGTIIIVGILFFLGIYPSSITNSLETLYDQAGFMVSK